MAEPKRIFLDCGAHDGCSIAKFLKAFPDSDRYAVHAFEANPRMREFLANRGREEFRHVEMTIHDAAVSDRDGVAPFYLGRGMGKQWGASLSRTKKTGGLVFGSPLSVRTLDLSRWIAENFHSDDEIVLKLNVEGAEYQVLPAMMMDRTLAWISRLYVNWHADKIGLPRKVHDAVVEETNRVVPVASWNADDYSKI